MVHMERLADRSAEMGRTVWIDMESSAYVDGTIELYAALLARSPNTGLCLQAYLRRTWDDVQKLAPLGPTIRLVKGAYREPKDIAFQDKRVIDESYLRLASHLATSARRLALGTHDTDLVARIEAAVPGGREAFEVAMLYGIRSDEQRRLAREGYTVRTLIAYGPVLVPVVHAPDRREAGREHAPRVAERVLSTVEDRLRRHGTAWSDRRRRDADAGRRSPPGRGGVRAARAAHSWSGGIDGLLACGTTGEGVLLSVDERRRVAESFLDGPARWVPGRRPRRSTDHVRHGGARRARARGRGRRGGGHRAAVLPARRRGAHATLRAGRERVRSAAVLPLRVRRRGAATRSRSR